MNLLFCPRGDAGRFLVIFIFALVAVTILLLFFRGMVFR